MPECIDCGSPIRTGARCQMHRVEQNHDHHEFFQDEDAEEREAERLLGKAINHSSQNRRADAALCVEDALEAAPNLSYDAWSKIQAAKTVEGSEFRRYLEQAIDALEAEGSK